MCLSQVDARMVELEESCKGLSHLVETEHEASTTLQRLTRGLRATLDFSFSAANSKLKGPLAATELRAAPRLHEIVLGFEKEVSSG
jgi:hypothetical protein